MFTLNNITKVEEGIYEVDSLPCPHCGKVWSAIVKGEQVFAYHQGAPAQEVFPEWDTSERERFITGYCDPCWVKIFGTDED